MRKSSTLNSFPSDSESDKSRCFGELIVFVVELGGLGGPYLVSTMLELRTLVGKTAISLKSSSKLSIELSNLLPLKFFA